MKQSLLLVLILSFLLSACGAEKGIEVQGAWARPATHGGNGAIYFSLYNHGQAADELTGVSCDVAEAVEMHESIMSGDVMQMHQLEAVPLPTDTKTTFKPGGLHVMLINLKKDLKIGEEIEVTLHFKNSEDIKIPVLVRELPAADDD